MASKIRKYREKDNNELYVLFADRGSIMSLEDSNNIYINNVFVITLNAHQIYNTTFNEGDVIKGDKCIIGAGEFNSNSHFSYMPKYMKGKLLQTSIERYNPTEIKFYSFGTGTVQIVNNTTVMTTLNVVPNTVYTYTNNNDGVWKLVSTVDILGQIRSGTGDPHCFVWGTDIKIGFSSSQGRLSTLSSEANTNYIINHYNNDETGSDNGIGSNSVGGSGSRTYESIESSSKVIAENGKLVFAHSYADSDGGCSASWLPPSLMYHTVGLPHETEFISFINRSGKGIRKYDVNGNIIGTLLPTKNNVNAWYAYRDGTPNGQLNIPKGTIYSSDEKFYSVYQNKDSSIYAAVDDETTLLPSNLDFKYG